MAPLVTATLLVKLAPKVKSFYGPKKSDFKMVYRKEETDCFDSSWVKLVNETKKCRWCGDSDGEAYHRSSEYSFVDSCDKPKCMEKTDSRIEEIMESEENGEE